MCKRYEVVRFFDSSCANLQRKRTHETRPNTVCEEKKVENYRIIFVY